MTHRFLVPPEAIASETVSFSESQWHQLRNVLRLRPGARVRVFDGEQPVDYLVQLGEAAEGVVVDQCQQPPEPRIHLTAYPALLQRDKFEPILQKLTEIGVSAIVPVITARSLVREPPDEARLSRWRSIIAEAVEQCGRGRVPSLLPALPLAEAIRTAEGIRIMAYEGEQRGTLSDALSTVERNVSIFVGPEGGYTADEVQQASAAGISLVTLGPRILRTETASPMLAALVLYERGDLSWRQDP